MKKQIVIIIILALIALGLMMSPQRSSFGSRKPKSTSGNNCKPAGSAGQEQGCPCSMNTQCKSFSCPWYMGKCA